jgi:hypothetical protein
MEPKDTIPRGQMVKEMAVERLRRMAAAEPAGARRIQAATVRATPSRGSRRGD